MFENRDELNKRGSIFLIFNWRAAGFHWMIGSLVPSLAVSSQFVGGFEHHCRPTKMNAGLHQPFLSETFALLGTNISSPEGTFEDDFPFQRRDMLVPWRVSKPKKTHICHLRDLTSSEGTPFFPGKFGSCPSWGFRIFHEFIEKVVVLNVFIFIPTWKRWISIETTNQSWFQIAGKFFSEFLQFSTYKKGVPLQKKSL